MTENLYLVGFMGAGKNAVGRKLADMLNRRLVDMDTLLENRFGMCIREVFAKEGEGSFRDGESALLQRLSQKRRLVVATGGGLPEREKNRQVMHKSGKIIHLNVKLESCMKRLTPDDQETRPKWENNKAVRALFERRKPLYADCDLSVFADDQRPEEVAEAIVNELFPEQRFEAVLGNRACQTICTWHAPRVLGDLVQGRRSLILTDRTVAKLHLERFSRALGDPSTVIIPPGERSKTLRRSTEIYETLLEHRYERADILVAIGGGVITDLGAYVASTYKRGMDSVLVATSLLGCVDAAIGGKAAVNLGVAKNVVGCFATPVGVVLDIASLRTLPRRAVAEGLVEAYKTGLVADPQLAALIERETSALMAKDLPVLSLVAWLSAKAKSEVVNQDFQEQGLRRILNFGHTYGHAVEGWSAFRVNHGKAVAAGMIVATRISANRGLLPWTVAGRILSTLQRIDGGKLYWPSVEQAWEIMENDKKVRGGHIVFVLLEDVGKPICVEDVSRQELAEAVKEGSSGLNGQR